VRAGAFARTLKDPRGSAGFDDWLGGVGAPKGRGDTPHLNMYDDFLREAPKKILVQGWLAENFIIDHWLGGGGWSGPLQKVGGGGVWGDPPPMNEVF
jgi:hypothetical protein